MTEIHLKEKDGKTMVSINGDTFSLMAVLLVWMEHDPDALILMSEAIRIYSVNKNKSNIHHEGINQN